MKTQRIKVKGKVQGVFFRKSTQEKATELDLAGWVRNEPDGSVLLEAEGPEEAMQRLVDWLHQGPPAAEVDSVEASDLPPAGFHDFRIKH